MNAMLVSRAGGRVTGRRHRGQVMFIALLAVLLLAGMVFYVFNLGDQVNRRVSMQNAADSAAIGGATWMARSMNVVAMNNVAQSRLITMAAVLDSLPLATDMTYNEMTALIKGQEALLAQNLQDPFLVNGINQVRQRFVEQQQRLEPLDQALVQSGYDVCPLTFWRLDGASGPPPHGKLWVGAKALEDFNRATYETAGLLSQAAGARMGGSCIVRDPDAAVSPQLASAFIVPVLPEMPAKLGQFMDFQKPVMEGRPPEYVAGTVADQIRRGAYDQLFHWREAVRDKDKPPVVATLGKTWVPPTSSDPQNANGKPGLSPPPPGAQGGHWDYQTQVIAPGQPGPQIGWRTYGTYAWSVVKGNSVPSSGLAHYCWNYLPDLPASLYPDVSTSNFLARLQKLSLTKLNYMWGTASAQTIHQPNWIVSYPKAKAQAASNLNSIKYTWLWILRIRSSLPPDSAGYRTAAGTYYPPMGSRDYDPYNCPMQKGWLDPADPANVGKFGKTKQIAEGVWQTDWTYQVEFDETIGIHAPVGPQPPGTTLPLQTVYVRDQFVFFGVDVGDEVPIRNPANWTASDEPPRPYLMDLTKCDYRTDGERYYLAFLGVARMTATPSFWPQKFSSANPYPNVLAVAEAHVFNNQSWDLWTQDWQTRLRPVGSWDYWANQRIETAPGDLDEVRQYVNGSDLMQVKQALQGFDPEMVARVITH